MRSALRAAVFTICILVISFNLSEISAARSSKTSPFVKRSGTQFLLNGRQWKMYGGSNYGTINPGAAGTIAGTTSLAVSAKLNTVRLVNYLDESGVDSNAPYDESSWRRVDQSLASLAKSGLKAILDLSTYRNYLQNHALAAGSTLTPYSQDWGPFIHFVATRKNTVNRVLYKNDPTIAIVSFAGEPNAPNSEEPLKPTREELTNFYSRVLSQWRALDPNHLLSSGGLDQIDWEERFNNPDGSGIDWQAIFALPGNDVPSIHNYGLTKVPSTDYVSPKVSAYCAQLGKPWITEEFGFSQAEGDSARAAHYQQIYDEQSTYGSAGVLFWNLGGEVSSDTFDVNSDTPLTWATVQANAPT
jgi:endo-1,4-beta-mannosidase